jgi:enoyl-CoA hydratase
MTSAITRDRPLEFVVRLQLDRPVVRNALNRAVIEEFHEHLDTLGDQDVRVLIITGAGESFCAGADLQEIQTMTPPEGHEFSRLGHELFRRIEELPYPVIAAVNGHALGGGCELACTCDLRYATTSARFGQPESRVGMIPGWGGTFRLPRIVGVARAKELIFTSRLIEAPEAHEIGLVNDVYPEETFEDRVLDTAETIASNAPIANREAKRLLNLSRADLRGTINGESLALSYCISTEDQTEAVEAFFEKREPSFHTR